MTLEELYENAVSMPRMKRIEVAGVSGNELLKYMKGRGLDDEASFKFIMYLVALFAGADGEIDDAEVDLFNYITDAGVSRKDLQEGLQGLFVEEFVASMDDLIDRMPEDQKGNCCLFGLAFVSADGRISEREKEVFERILA